MTLPLRKKSKASRKVNGYAVDELLNEFEAAEFLGWWMTTISFAGDN